MRAANGEGGFVYNIFFKCRESLAWGLTGIGDMKVKLLKSQLGHCKPFIMLSFTQREDRGIRMFYFEDRKLIVFTFPLKSLFLLLGIEIREISSTKMHLK